MREKILAMRPKVGASIHEPFFYLTPEGADQILILLREEIERVENPADLLPLHDTRRNYWQDGFENCRRKILALLESGMPNKEGQ